MPHSSDASDDQSDHQEQADSPEPVIHPITRQTGENHFERHDDNSRRPLVRCCKSRAVVWRIRHRCCRSADAARKPKNGAPPHPRKKHGITLNFRVRMLARPRASCCRRLSNLSRFVGACQQLTSKLCFFSQSSASEGKCKAAQPRCPSGKGVAAGRRGIAKLQLFNSFYRLRRRVIALSESTLQSCDSRENYRMSRCSQSGCQRTRFHRPAQLGHRKCW
jgi:hypothetical protein